MKKTKSLSDSYTVVDYTGEKYGSLTVMEEVPPVVYSDGRKRRVVLCKCDCGKVVKRILSNIRRGNAPTCGSSECLNPDCRRLYLTSTYSAWKNLRSRCRGYGGRDEYKTRGITFSDRWDSFENFYSDMGDHPGKGFSIDRIDNSGGYCKENCRWATVTQQARNKSTNVFFSIEGETLCLSEIAEKYGVPRSRVSRRIKAGWTIEDAVSIPKLVSGWRARNDARNIEAKNRGIEYRSNQEPFLQHNG